MYEKTKNPGLATRVEHLVARTRFELVISALRGRRPEPLDERAVCGARLRRKDITGTGTGAQGGFVRKSNLWMTCGGALDRSGLARGPADGTGLRAGCRTGLVRWAADRDGSAGRAAISSRITEAALAPGSPTCARAWAHAAALYFLRMARRRGTSFRSAVQ